MRQFPFVLLVFLNLIRMQHTIIKYSQSIIKAHREVTSPKVRQRKKFAPALLAPIRDIEKTARTYCNKPSDSAPFPSFLDVTFQFLEGIFLVYFSMVFKG